MTMSRKRSLAWWGRLVAVLTVPLAISACGDDDVTAEDPIVVRITGAHGLALGATVSLSATTEGATDSSYTWESSVPGVATVDSSGVVTGVAVGETIITATGADSGASGEHAIVVTEDGGVTPTPSVTVSGNPFVRVGASEALTATTVGGTDASYAWTSSDVEVATVDDTGLVTGVGDGTATITATGADTGESGELLVTVSVDIPNYDLWVNSGHADYTAEAFNHWNEDGEIPTSCARCHSTPGYVDYLGADGTAFEVVDNPAPLGTVIECGACHNSVASELAQVTFPSGAVLQGVESGPARCMTCHQGRESTDTVDEHIAGAAVADADTVSGDLRFRNVHYFAAGATLYGGEARGGYQYAGKTYDWKFSHVEDYDGCTGCHDPHSLEVKVSECANCHTGVAAVEDLRDVRMMASLANDYDGDGDLAEGIYYEIEGLHGMLLAAIQAYATEQGNPICYDSHRYPYWFADADGDGTCADTDTGYASWTARLVRATYNYQFAAKDPGAFAHNAKYVIQLLYDAIEDLNVALTTDVDLTAATRTDQGHFDGSAEPARHWDEDGEVSASCSKCHGSDPGYSIYTTYGVSLPVEPGNGLACGTCHSSFAPDWNPVALDGVTFPSGVTLTLQSAGHPDNICGTCHSGRESGADVDEAIAAGSPRFLNVHYLPAAAVRYGSEAAVGYEYAGRTYSTKFTFSAHDACNDCHSPVATNHTFHPQDNPSCTTAGCHASGSGGIVTNIRFASVHVATDYDGDGSTTEPLADELATFDGRLLAGMQAYATATAGVSDICYFGGAYPYWFIDTNGNGACDGTEASYGNRYNTWDATLARAGFNYQLFHKEPGGWAHNFNYMGQLLYDSIEAVGGSLTGLTRPAP